MTAKHLMVMLLGLLMCSCAYTEAQSTSSADTDDYPRVLVAYYSATGTTERVARTVADAGIGTLLVISPETPYTEDDLNWRDSLSRSSVEMHNPAMRPSIDNELVDLADYDIIFLGYPIWWNEAPRVINSWIEFQDLNGTIVIPFATSGGDDITNSVKELQALYPQIRWHNGKLLNNMTPTEVSEWTQMVCEQFNHNTGSTTAAVEAEPVEIEG